jgi:hypothetical protein
MTVGTLLLSGISNRTLAYECNRLTMTGGQVLTPPKRPPLSAIRRLANPHFPDFPAMPGVARRVDSARYGSSSPLLKPASLVTPCYTPRLIASANQTFGYNAEGLVVATTARRNRFVGFSDRRTSRPPSPARPRHGAVITPPDQLTARDPWAATPLRIL